MFAWLRKNPLQKLEAEYRRLLEQARDLQRGGDIKGFAAMTARAEAVAAEIDRVRARS